jgi:hypothetical protein
MRSRGCGALALLVLAACGRGAADPGVAAAVRDSAGATLVENGAAVPARWELASTPALVIGGDEGDASTQLHYAFSATLLTSGSVAIGNAGTAQVLIFEADGRRRGVLGRRGDGPGEFRSTMLMRVLPSGSDEVIAEELGLERRLFRFDGTGALVSDVRSRFGFVEGGAWSGFATSPGGASFVLREPMPAADAIGFRPVRANAALLRFEHGSATLDTIARLPGSTHFSADIGPLPAFGGGTATGPRVLTPLFAAQAALAGGGEPFIVALGDQAHAGIDVHDEAGALVRRIRWHAVGRAPSSRDVALAREAYLEGSATARRDPAAGRRALDAMPRVDATPVFGALLVDRTSHIWVQRYPLPGEALHEWWIFAPDGVLTATAATPADRTVLEIGADHLLARVTDALGVERVELWPLVRVAPTP